MKVLMVASEAYPFVSTGGLGEVVGALPKVLKKDGVDIRVILPKYKTIDYDFTKDFKFIKYYFVDIVWRRQYCGVFEYEYEGVLYYFIDVNKETPLISVISRLTHQEGLDLIVNSLDRILQKNIQIVILGSGDKAYEETLKKLNYIYRDKISVNLKFNEDLSHNIYAGADMLLMPSLFEPCGLGQLIALRYGTVPIVREVGGLKDSILNFNTNSGVGNGFTFKNYTPSELLKTIDYAIEIYNNKKLWNSLIEQGMNCDNSWERSSKEYKLLYEKIIHDSSNL